MARFVLSQDSEWELEHESQDIRGWNVIDAKGDAVGRVAELIADTETEHVEVVRLEDGREFPVEALHLGDVVVFLDAVAAAPDAAPYTRRPLRRRAL